MKSYFRFTFILFFFLGIFVLQSSNVLAGIEHNIRGKAYTENGKFIYFNCLDQPSGSFPYTFTFLLGGDPCEIEYEGVGGAMIDNYGVHLNYNTYVFTGHARHENFGLISFENKPKDDNYDFLNNCPNVVLDDCQEVNCSACYNSESQRVYGWAYVVVDDDWIKLDSDEIDYSDRMGVFNYTSSKAGDFFGFFYYDKWQEVDLNCSESGSGCSPNYKVYVGMVELAEMSAPYWGESQACSTTAKGAVLRWKVHGGQFNRYEIRINDENDFSTADEFSLEEEDPGYNSFQATIGENGFNYNLDWNTSYYWWLRLHDDVLYNTSTDWIQFDHGDTPVDGVQGVLTHNEIENEANNLTDPNLTFTTYKHEWPRPQFTWEGDPETSFQAGAANKFWVKDITNYYTSPTTSVSFTDPSFIENFLWWGTINGVVSDKITIVDAIDFPEAIEPVFRLDASTILGLEHNDLVESWEDISSNTNDVSQNLQNKRPKYHINALNGRPAVYFNGTINYLKNDDLNIEQSFTVFVVAQSEDSLNDAYLLDSNIEDNVSLGYSDDNQYLMWAGQALKGGSIDDNLSLWTAYYQSNNSFLQIKQTESTVNITNSLMDSFINNKDGIIIGASKDEDKYWQGYIAEIIIYDLVLTSSEREEIEDYLALKWGIDEKDQATASSVYVYFESIEDDQKIWLSLTDPTGYTCSTSTDSLNVNYELPLWREIRARE
jgi:hypothetical protein